MIEYASRLLQWRGFVGAVLDIAMAGWLIGGFLVP
jgi:hypothetical protein